MMIYNEINDYAQYSCKKTPHRQQVRLVEPCGKNKRHGKTYAQ